MNPVTALAWGQTSACRIAVALAFTFTFVACGGGSGGSAATPTAPTPTPPVGGPPAIQISALDVAKGELSVNWTAVSGAQRYVIEAGSSSGASDITTMSVDAPATAAVLADVTAQERVYVRVKAANASGPGPASRELRIGMPDLRDVAEALFFGTGPYSITGTARTAGGRMYGWAPGSRVAVRIPAAVSGEQFDAVVRTVNEANALMGLNLSIERTSMTLAQWTQQQPLGITVLIGEGVCRHPDGNAADCATSTPTPTFTRSLIRMQTATDDAKTWAHELGHALGLQHVYVQTNAENLGAVPLFSPHVPVMGTMLVSTEDGGRYGPPATQRFFTDMELEAIRRVYAAGLRPGSTVGDFAARGLIRP